MGLDKLSNTIVPLVSNSLSLEMPISSPNKKEAFMFVRLTFVKFSPEAVNEAKRIYKKEVIPAVRKQKGNVNISLLEPTERSDDFISLTEWKTKADADAYEASGLYKQLVNRLKDYFTKAAVLKTYTAEEVLIATH